MSVLEDVLRELRTGAGTATVARRLQISDDLAGALVDHWVRAGAAVVPPTTAGVPPRSTGRTGARPEADAAPCHGCAPRPLWRTPLSCHGCPFAAVP